MRLTIELTADEEEQLQAVAQAEGLDLATLARKLVTEPLPAVPPNPSTPEIDSKNRAAIAMLQSWLAEGASEDPEKIRLAEEEVEELKRNLNANRTATGERPVFR